MVRKIRTTTKTEAQLAKERYTPVRRGAIYCSPFCGHGCTWAKHQAAVKAAKALCKVLGKGWTPRVWENLGWHYEALFGEPVPGSHNVALIEVAVHHYNGVADYTAWLQTSPQIITDSFPDPLKAVRALKVKMRERARQLTASIALLKNAEEKLPC